MSNLEVLYHDGPCLVVNKPAGILTQAPPGIDSVEVRVRNYFRSQEEKADDTKIYTGVPHRLDRPVSGAMVFARHVRASRRLSAQFEKRTVKKTYWALVPTEANRDLPEYVTRSSESGELTELPKRGTWRDHLRKIPGRSFVKVVEPEYPGGKHAILHFEVKQKFSNVALLEITLETGRTHQIRVQFASRGFPILGDDQYGSTATFGPDFGDDPRDRAIALHARQLQFRHPMVDQQVDIEAPLSDDWAEFAS